MDLSSDQGGCDLRSTPVKDSPTPVANTPEELETSMYKIKLLTTTAIVAFAFVGTAFAADPMVGGAAMSTTKISFRTL